MTRDENTMMNMIQTMLGPLVSKLQTLEDKVDKLNTDRATRSDIEKLRHDMVSGFVPRDAYEARHSALIERDTQLESRDRELQKIHETDIKELREDVEKDLQRIHERLETGKQQLEDRIKQQQEVQLSTKDRTWLRFSQGAGAVSIIIAVLDWLFQHIKLQ